MARLLDLTGRTFGRLTVVERAPNVPGRGGGQARWVCRCACGMARTRPIQGQRLRSGDTRSCGCLLREVCSKRLKAHPAILGHKARVGRSVWPRRCPTCGRKFEGTLRSIYCRPTCRPKYPRFAAT